MPNIFECFDKIKLNFLYCSLKPDLSVKRQNLLKQKSLNDFLFGIGRKRLEIQDQWRNVLWKISTCILFHESKWPFLSSSYQVRLKKATWTPPKSQQLGHRASRTIRFEGFGGTSFRRPRLFPKTCPALESIVRFFGTQIVELQL